MGMDTSGLSMRVFAGTYRNLGAIKSDPVESFHLASPKIGTQTVAPVAISMSESSKTQIQGRFLSMNFVKQTLSGIE